ncbi:MAG: primosomal protein DnaI [bacterium]|nr:primosomal protein DnaI [bacterium]
MENINNYISKKNDDISLKQNYIKHLEDYRFKSVIKLFNIKEELGCKYTSLIMDSSVEIDNCKNCKGLFECKNSIKGYCNTPVVKDKVINFSYNMCRYLNKEQYKDNLTLFDVPKSIKNASLKDVYTNDKNRIAIIKEIKKFISDYKNDKNPKGIYLYGSFGSGKTYLIAALFNELAKTNVKSVIVHVPELMRDLKESFSNSYSEKFSALKRVPLLLLDDIGAEYITAWSRDEVLEPILQYRMDQGLPTFFTSNFSVDELEKHFSMTNNSIDKVKAKRIIERVKQLSNSVELISKNLRS